MTGYLNTNFDYNSKQLVEVFDELPLWSAPFGLGLLDNIEYKKNITALDIGFGAGFPLTEIAMRLGSSSRVYGIDVWKEAINRTKRKINQYGIKNIEVINTSAETMPFENNFFDLITSNNGINNIPDFNAVINECARVIKPGGQLVQSMNLNNTMFEFYEILKDVLKSLDLNKSVEEIDRHVFEMRKPIEFVTDALTENNFTIKDIVQDKFTFKYADGTSFLNHYYIRLGFMYGWKTGIPENRMKDVFAKVEQQINEMSKTRGYFKLTIPYIIIDARKNTT